MGEILVFTAVGDQTIATLFEVEFGYQALYRGEEVGEKGRIAGGQIGEGRNGSFGDEQDMQRVIGPGVMESQEGFSFAQAANGESEAHVGKDEWNKLQFAKGTIQQVSEFSPHFAHHMCQGTTPRKGSYLPPWR